MPYLLVYYVHVVPGLHYTPFSYDVRSAFAEYGSERADSLSFPISLPVEVLRFEIVLRRHLIQQRDGVEVTLGAEPVFLQEQSTD